MQYPTSTSGDDLFTRLQMFALDRRPLIPKYNQYVEQSLENKKKNQGVQEGFQNPSWNPRDSLNICECFLFIP